MFEIALKLGYIAIYQVSAQAKPISNTEYSCYLLQLIEQPDPA